MTAEEDLSVEDAYDELAATYDAAAEANPLKAHLEFPATTSLVPGIAGHRVLDVGCGTGRYAEWLVDRGADVVGVDVSTDSNVLLYAPEHDLVVVPSDVTDLPPPRPSGRRT